MPHSPNRPSPCGVFVGFLPGASWLNTWLSDESDEVDVSEVLNILSNEVIQQVRPEEKHGKNWEDGSTKMIVREQGMDRIEIVGVLGKLSAFDFCTCSFLFDGIFMFQAL